METEISDKGSNKNRLMKLVNFVESSISHGDEIVMDCDIPECLLMEILFRLPPMIACRFKLVSKRWLSIISDPFFIRHYNRLPQRWSILSCTMLNGLHGYNALPKDMYSQDDFQPKYFALSLRSPMLNWSENYRIFAVSSGLILDSSEYFILDETEQIYRICNPITGHWIALPPLITSRLCKDGYGFLAHVEDSILKSYVVVLLDLWKHMLIIEVFFSETGEWNKIYLPNDRGIQFTERLTGTNLNGVLHWASHKHGIIAYDPYRDPQSIRLIAFPSVIPNRECHDAGISLCSADLGKLRYLEVSSYYFEWFKVWVLNDYDSGDWCLEIDSENVLHSAEDFSRPVCLLINPICLHPFDSNIVYSEYEGELSSYNIKTQKIQDEHELFGDVSFHKVISKDFLDLLFMIPPWPISIPKPSFGAINYDKSMLVY